MARCRRRRWRSPIPARDLDRGPIGPAASAAVPIAPKPRAPRWRWRARRAAAGACGWLDARPSRRASRPPTSARAPQPEVEIVARARLPLEGMPTTQIVAFRATDDGQEHVALVIGAFGGKPPLVRLHSECLTGDVFGSLKCDCGPQLQGSAADHRRGRRRRAALSAPGRPRDRPCQQAARLCAAGPRARHGRRQPPPRLCRRRARLWPCGGDAARAWDRPSPAADQQSGQGRRP